MASSKQSGNTQYGVLHPEDLSKPPHVHTDGLERRHIGLQIHVTPRAGK